MDCDKRKINHGCQGGYATVALEYLKSHGSVDPSCPALLDSKCPQDLGDCLKFKVEGNINN